MARVTVEDCAKVVPSRFELVALAAQRAKAIASGSEIAVDRDNDKNPVVALREIAARKVDVEALRENLIKNMQQKVFVDQYGVEETDEVELAKANISAELEEEMRAFQHDGAKIEADEDDGMFEQDEILDPED